MAETSGNYLALFEGDELLKNRFIKKCVLNSESSDSSNIEADWGGDSGDDNFLYQMTDIAETGAEYNDTEMFSESEPKVIPDTPSEEENLEEIKDAKDTEIDNETEELKRLLAEVGLIYSNVVSKHCINTKGLVVCNMTCKVDIKTEFQCKAARTVREEAVLAALRDILGKVRKKFFPEFLKFNEQLSVHRESLVRFCKEQKLGEPEFGNWLEGGLYCASVLLDGELAKSSKSYHVLDDAYGSASQVWMDLFGGVKVKKVAVSNNSSAFDLEFDDEIVNETLSKENLPSLDSFSSKDLKKVPPVESNRRPKKGGFLSSLDNMTEAVLAAVKVDSMELEIPSIKTAFALLDKKTISSKNSAKTWSPRNEAASLPRRSPRKQNNIHNLLQNMNSKKLMQDIFDDSSTSVASQSDPESEEQETPIKRPRSESLEVVSAKKLRQEQVGKQLELELSCSSGEMEKRTKASPPNTKAKSPENKSIGELKPTHQSSKSSKATKKKVGMFEKLNDKIHSVEEKTMVQEVQPPPLTFNSKLLPKKKLGTFDKNEVKGAEKVSLPTQPGSQNKVSSPKKKVSIFGKLKEKQVDVEVKPKFQFSIPIKEEKSIVDHFGSGKAKMSVDNNDSTSNKKFKILDEKLDKEVISRSRVLDDNVPKKRSSVKKSNVIGEVKEEVREYKEDSKKSVEKRKVKNKPAIESVETSADKPVFKFSDKDKVDAQKPSKSKNNSSKCDVVENAKEPESKKSISSVFEFEDDPYVLEIEAKKKEAEKLAVRTKAKTKGKKRQSMARMAEFSQSLTGSQSSLESPQESRTADSRAKFKIPKTRKSSKKKNVDASQKKIINFFKTSAPVKDDNVDEFDEARDYTPSIDELLKIPERSDDGGKTMDEVLDDLDMEIAERKRKHEEEMAKIDTDITAEKLRQGERRQRMKVNASLRDRLEEEITESKLRRMFSVNIEYLDNIKRGTIESSRHKAFYKSSRTRHALYYTMITDPFTDDQLEWTLDEIGKVWMKNKREQMDNNEYVWKVLLAECFIKFYMDFFNFDKAESEKRISETPLHKKVESDDEISSEEEV